MSFTSEDLLNLGFVAYGLAGLIIGLFIYGYCHLLYCMNTKQKNAETKILKKLCATCKNNFHEYKKEKSIF